MAEWWYSLGLLGQILTCIAIPSTLILIIQVIMNIAGFGGHGEADIDADSVELDDMDTPDEVEFSDGVFGDGIDPDGHDFQADTDTGFRLFTMRTIVAFFTMFSWGGLVALRYGLSDVTALLVAFAAGWLTMFFVALIYRWFLKLQSDGTANVRNALGKSGMAYLRIPAAREGTGKVMILLQGTLTEMNAVTDEESPILSGKPIVVIGLSGGNTVVVKSK